MLMEARNPNLPAPWASAARTLGLSTGGVKDGINQANRAFFGISAQNEQCFLLIALLYAHCPEAGNFFLRHYPTHRQSVQESSHI